MEDAIDDKPSPTNDTQGAHHRPSGEQYWFYVPDPFHLKRLGRVPLKIFNRTFTFVLYQQVRLGL